MTDLLPLTDRQAEILAAIRRHIEKTGYPPTRRELADQFHLSGPNAVKFTLGALVKKGHIWMDAEKSRGIRPRCLQTSIPILRIEDL